MKYGAYIWTASAAGWAYLAYLTAVPAALIVAGACLWAAFIWTELYNDNERGGTTRRSDTKR